MTDHGRSKYRRTIHDIDNDTSITVDVYSVLEAFAVTCPARQHLIKKILCTGIRGKGDSLQDLQEAKVALDRAFVLEQQRQIIKEPEEKEGIFVTHKEGQDTEVTKADVDAPGQDVQGWSIYSVFDEQQKPIGYRVGWHCDDGRYFMVGHYMAAENAKDGPSLDWCEVAAESHAKRLNEKGKRPEEFDSFRFLKAQETKSNV